MALSGAAAVTQADLDACQQINKANNAVHACRYSHPTQRWIEIRYYNLHYGLAVGAIAQNLDQPDITKAVAELCHPGTGPA